MSLSKVFESVKSRTSGPLNSGITARTRNIFSVSVYDYTISAVQYKRSVNSPVQAVTTTGTSHSDQLHYITRVFEAVWCKAFFFLLSPISFRLVSHRVIHQNRADFDPWQLAPSRGRSYRKLKKIYKTTEELQY